MLVNFFKFSKERTLRLKKNLFSQFSMISFFAIIHIIFPPLMIFFWGAENFGIWIFISFIPGTLYLLQLDFSHAAKQEMIMLNAKRKFHEVNKIFQNNIALILINLSFLTIVIYLISFFFNVNSLKIFNTIPENDLSYVIVFILAVFYLELFNTILISGISFLGKLYITTNITTFFEFIIKISIAFAGKFFDSLVYAALILFILSILKTCVYFYFFLLNKKYLKFSVNLFSLKIFKKLIILSLPQNFEALSQSMKNNGQVILFGIFFNPQIIAYTSTCKTMFYYFPYRFFYSFISISWLEYARMYAGNKIKQFKNYHRKHTILILCLIFIFIILSLGIGPFLYKVWLNDKFSVTYTFLLLLIFELSLVMLTMTLIAGMKSLNNYFKLSTIHLSITIISMVISIILLKMNYSFISFFVVMLIQSILALFISIHFVYKFNKSISYKKK